MINGYMQPAPEVTKAERSFMLHEMIARYAEALMNNDIRLARRIERELSTLGMDKATLLVLVREYMKEELS